MKNHDRCIPSFPSSFLNSHCLRVNKLSLELIKLPRGQVQGSGVCWDIIMSWSTVNALSITNTKGPYCKRGANELEANGEA